MSKNVKLDRRHFLIGSVAAGIAGVAAAAIHDGELGAPPQTFRGSVPWQEGTADAPPGASGSGYVYFTPAEAAFIEAAVGAADPERSGRTRRRRSERALFPGSAARRTLRPRRSLLSWRTVAQGHAGTGLSEPLQSRATLSRGHCGDRQIRRREFQARRHSRKLAAADQDKVLKGLESGEIKLDDGVDSKSFFAMLLQNTKEGYFSDPIYGGNKDMGAWKMIGFPGAHYDYKEWVTRHGERVPYPHGRLQGPSRLDGELNHDHHPQTRRCSVGGLRLDRRHHGPAALRRRLERGGAGARSVARHAPPISRPDLRRTSCATCGAIICFRTSPTTR